MIDFSLTPEQKTLQKVAREFSQEILKPLVRAADAEPDPQKGFQMIKPAYEKAYEMGFVNKVLPIEELLPYAHKQAAKLVALPAASIRVTKRLMKGDQPQAISSKMTEENMHFATMLNAPEAKEAFMAFFQKRKPDFSKFN